MRRPLGADPGRRNYIHSRTYRAPVPARRIGRRIGCPPSRKPERATYDLGRCERECRPRPHWKCRRICLRPIARTRRARLSCRRTCLSLCRSRRRLHSCCHQADDYVPPNRGCKAKASKRALSRIVRDRDRVRNQSRIRSRFRSRSRCRLDNLSVFARPSLPPPPVGGLDSSYHLKPTVAPVPGVGTGCTVGFNPSRPSGVRIRMPLCAADLTTMDQLAWPVFVASFVEAVNRERDSRQSSRQRSRTGSSRFSLWITLAARAGETDT